MRRILIAAITLDGFIAEKGTPGTGFTSEADQKWFHKALCDFDCSVMGRKTYAAGEEEIRSGLYSGRLRKVMTHSPERYASLEVPDHLEFTSEPPNTICRELESRGRKACAILGGGSVYGAFLRENRIDELWITVEPVVFGAGVPLLEGQMHQRLELLSTDSLSAHTLLLKYRPIRT